MENFALLPAATWQTPYRGTNDQEYQIYRDCMQQMQPDKPVKTYEEWLNS